MSSFLKNRSPIHIAHNFKLYIFFADIRFNNGVRFLLGVYLISISYFLYIKPH